MYVYIVLWIHIYTMYVCMYVCWKCRHFHGAMMVAPDVDLATGRDLDRWNRNVRNPQPPHAHTHTHIHTGANIPYIRTLDNCYFYIQFPYISCMCVCMYVFLHDNIQIVYENVITEVNLYIHTYYYIMVQVRNS